MARPILPLTKELFESKVAYVPFSSCHYWNGPVNDQGYGLFRLKRAHRLSYRLYKGPIPETINGERAVIRHKCDTSGRETGVAIAEYYDVLPSFVSDIKRGVTYASVSGFRKAL